ncbi:MAG: domain S-box [Planctomycetota bacterium]|nr:domain S-box [Planctomycetota bacterium]
MRYGLALGAVALATLVRFGLDPLVSDGLPFVTYYLAVTVIALVLGVGPALLALGLGSALALYYFVPPRYTLLISTNRTWIALGFFLLVGVVNALLSEALRQARRLALDGQAALRRELAERATMEERIREADARFRAFMDNSPALGYLKDEAGRYLWGNRAWLAQLDRPESQVLGLDDFALWPEATARQFRDSDRQALEAGHAIEIAEAVGERHFISLKFPLEFGVGRYLGGMTLEVSDRVHAEQAVRRNEALLHALADSMPQMVWAARPDGHLDYYNRRWFEYTGFTEAETFSHEGWKPILHADDVARCDAAWYGSVRSGQPYQIEYRFKDRPTGGYRWFLGRALPVRDETGAIVRWYGTSTDIDDQKRAEQAAEAANLAKDRFLAVLSHELRTPLTPVLLAVSSMLDDPAVSAETRPILEMIRRNVSLESRLIDDLLNLTRISRGSFTMQNETADGHDLLLQALEICRPDLDDAGLVLTVDLAARRHTVSADSARLQQAFWNLVKNAVKFTPRGGSITIRSRNEPPAAPDAPPLLIVEVSDTGVGIDPAFLPRMFEAFEQGEASPWTRRYGGLGLGLSITRSIVEGHSGTLSAHSPGPGLGATLRIALPTIPNAVPRPALAPAPPADGHPASSQPRAGPSLPRALRILVVEDDPTTLSVLASLLRHSRHAVTTANSVSSALAAVDGHPDAFDLIISDIGLPDGNGADLIRTLQSRHPFPAIALTGYGMDDDIARSLSAGFLSHLTKPIDFRALETVIDQVASSPPTDSALR